MKKKLCSILLALTMVLTLLPVSALAEEGTPAGGEPTPAEAPAASNVAKIDDHEYATLAAAVEAAESGATITLLSDVALDSTLTLDKNLILDLNGHIISNSDKLETKYYLVKVAYGAEVSIIGNKENSSINDTRTNLTGTITAICVFGNLTVDGAELTISRGVNGIAIKVDESGADKLGKLTVKSGKISSTQAIQNWGITTIDGGTFTGDVGSHAYSNIGGDLTINDGIFNGPVYSAQLKYNASWPTAQAKAKIVNGTFNGVVAEYYDDGTNGLQPVERSDKPAGDVNCKVTISGGTFSDLSALDYLANGANVTVKLAADTTKDAAISINGNVNLDLNGKTLTAYTTKKICGLNVADGATLTISDSGTNGKLTSQYTPISVSGTGKVIINSGTVESSNDYGIYALNDGTAIVNGGTVTSKDAALSGNNTTGNMNFEINGGTLTAEQGPAIYMPGQGKLTVTNGTLNGGISLRMGQVNISGGTINSISAGIDSPAKYYSFSGNAWLPDALYVFGGTYNSKDAQYGNSLNLNITGGTFNCLNDQGSAIAIYDLGKLAQTANVTISGGTFTTNSTTRKAYQVLNLSDIGVTAPKEGYNNPDYVGKVNSSLTGGTYSADPSKYVAPGYVASYNGSTYTVYYPVPVTSNNNNNSSSTTTKNPDGSTTTTTTDKATGAVTETTTTANGSVGTVKTDANGSTEISASISAADVKAAEQKNAPVIAPITVTPAASSAAAPVIKLSVPANAGEVAVAIPVVNAKQGTVAVRVNPDGTEEIIKTAVVTENGLVLGVKGSMQIKVINNSKNFADTVGHWAASDVDFVSARELFNGTAPALFSPEASMTRGMVVTVIARLAGENTDGGANWYDKGCAWAVANGVSDGTNPNGSITREQLAAMLYRYCGSPAASGSLSAYADAASVSAFGSDAMQWCVNNGIINGMDGLLNPQGQATRAQVSAMFARYIRLAAAK